MKAPEGFDLEKHKQYVESGRCPYVEHKTYCNGQAEHFSEHWAIFQTNATNAQMVRLPNAVIYEESLAYLKKED